MDNTHWLSTVETIYYKSPILQNYPKKNTFYVKILDHIPNHREVINERDMWNLVSG